MVEVWMQAGNEDPDLSGSHTQESISPRPGTNPTLPECLPPPLQAVPTIETVHARTCSPLRRLRKCCEESGEYLSILQGLCTANDDELPGIRDCRQGANAAPCIASRQAARPGQAAYGKACFTNFNACEQAVGHADAVHAVTSEYSKSLQVA